MLISMKNIKKNYKKGDNLIHALSDISIEIKKGEMVAIMGKSGSGKSTLLNIMAGLDILDSGEYLFEEKTVDFSNQQTLSDFRRENIGFVLQNSALIDEKNVFNNIALPLKYKRLSLKDINIKVNETAKNFAINDCLSAFPSQLSGGQAQRAAIARAVITEPNVVLADEPTGALDEETGKSIMFNFKKINLSGKTVIIVTHDKNIAEQCDRTIYIKDGKIVLKQQSLEE
ncbi:MAG: peptide transporter ATP-binding protein [Clostridia bacterium]|nr:peptide transporter ATP-binding protein [Clostridia bacterium]